jgi:eukaryotic-like serine/threonine-protein kinase
MQPPAPLSLWDRFQACRAQGLPGIPRPELLGCMMEAAQALDQLQQHHQMQHLDVKPQNLLLVDDHVEVIGFVQPLGDLGVSVAPEQGVTPVYAPPETFDGLISRHCDQYSLAIVYQELLTGERPFTGKNVRELLMRHLTSEPELDALPEHDQPIIARALSKKPDERYPSCTDMVRALRSAGR